MTKSGAWEKVKIYKIFVSVGVTRDYCSRLAGDIFAHNMALVPFSTLCTTWALAYLQVSLSSVISLTNQDV